MATAHSGKAVRRRRSPAHSVTFTPALKVQVERYARKHKLPFGAAVRVLVADQLRTLRSIEQLRRAHEWQVAQGWAEAEAIARGDRDEVSWEDIEAAHREAVARLARRKSRRAAG